MTRKPDRRLTEAELSVLGPLAEHRVLTLPQVRLLHPAATATLISRLNDAGLIGMARIFDGLPAAVSVSAGGLRALGSMLKPTPRPNLNQYRHELGVGWLWLAARAGRYGALERLTTERRMRSEDASAQASEQTPAWGIGLGVLGRYGRPRLHYPDLLLDTAGGHRVAMELELSAKSSLQLAQVMSAYASDSRLDHVLYLADGARVASRIRDAAGSAGIADRVHVSLLPPDSIAGAEIPTLQRARAARRGPRTPVHSGAFPGSARMDAGR